MRAGHHRNLSCVLVFAAGVFFLLVSPQAIAAQPPEPAPSDVALCNRPLFDPGQAISACTRLINGDPKGPQSAGWYNNRGIGKLKKGDLKHAIEDFAEALNRDSDFFDALKNRGIAYHMGEDYDSAIDDFNQALAIDDYSKRAAAVYNMRGASLSRKGEYGRAIKDFGQAIKLDGQYVQAYVNRGASFSALRQFSRAIADFDTAININSGYLLTYIHRGDARQQLADFNGAINDFTEVIRHDPADPKNWEAYAHRGEALRLTGDPAKSLADLNKALELNPNEKEVYINRAWTWADQGNLGKAIADCTEALLRDSRYALAYADRGKFKRLSTDLKGSLADLDKAVELDKSSPVALTFRGETLLEWNDIKGALGDFNKAIMILPDFVAAYTGRGQTYEKQGDLSKAKADYQKALKLSPDLDAGLARPAQKLAQERLKAIAEVEAKQAQEATERAAQEQRDKETEQRAQEAPPKRETVKSIPEDIRTALDHRGHALLIGVSDYKSDWPPLSNVKNDLQELKAGLEPYFETVDIESNPTVAKIRERMQEFLLAQYNSPSERLFIYYAGHGFTAFNQTSRDNDGYITGSDTPGKTVSKAVSFYDVDSWSRQTSARHVLMVFDSCFSGSLFETMGPEQEPAHNDFDSVRSLLRKAMRYYITAGRKTEEVAANSTFATLLLRGLHGGADVFQEGIISAEELGNYLFHEVPKSSPRPQTPQYKSIGTATLSEGQFFFLTKPTAADVPSPIPGSGKSKNKKSGKK
jgi:tetratricopeptide (TPR) repeat protein